MTRRQIFHFSPDGEKEEKGRKEKMKGRRKEKGKRSKREEGGLM